MTIETIFLCFCEDYGKNNGESKPYHMSRNLMEFIEKSRNLTKSRQTKRNEISTISRNPSSGDNLNES